MIRPEIKDIIKIGTQLTGIKIKNDHRGLTQFIIDFYTDEIYINLNLKQIDDKWNYDLQWRGFNYQYRYLQALLHEIAHYRQYKKSSSLDEWIEGSKICYINNYRENVADRYAKRYYKKFIKEDYNG